MDCVVYMDLGLFQCAQFLDGLKLLKLGNFLLKMIPVLEGLKPLLPRLTSLEVLLAALFISVSNRYQKKTYLSAFRDRVKRLQKCVSVKGGYFEGL